MVDTSDMIWEEKAVLDYLRDRRGQEVKMWSLINHYARTLDPELPERERKDISVSLVSRLAKEKKIKHTITPAGRMVRISELF